MTTAGTVRCLCVILSLVVYTESACTYTDHSGGLPSQSGGTVTQLGSLNACKSVCDGQSTCTGVYFTFPRCEWFNIPITLATSAADPVIFTSIRTCTPDTCSMTETANSEAVTSAQLTLDLSSLSSSCKTACLYVTQCTAFTYDSSTCVLHTGVASTSARAGFTHVTKCSSGAECCVDSGLSDTEGTSATNETLTATSDSCKALCLAISTCQATVYSGSTCKLFTSVPSFTSQSGSTFNQKTCAQGAQDGILTTFKVCSGSSRPEITLFLLCIFWITQVAAVSF